MTTKNARRSRHYQRQRFRRKRVKAFNYNFRKFKEEQEKYLMQEKQIPEESILEYLKKRGIPTTRRTSITNLNILEEMKKEFEVSKKYIFFKLRSLGFYLPNIYFPTKKRW